MIPVTSTSPAKTMTAKARAANSMPVRSARTSNTASTVSRGDYTYSKLGIGNGQIIFLKHDSPGKGGYLPPVHRVVLESDRETW